MSEPAGPQTSASTFERIGVVGRGPWAIALAETLGAGGAKTVVVGPEEMAAVAGFGLVVEASADDYATAESVLARIDEVAPEAVVAVATLALPVTELALASPKPSRVLGLRLTGLGPKATGLMEITRTMLTDPQALTDVTALVAGLGIAHVTVSDRPGALVPRLLLPYLNHAAQLLDEGYASREDLDAAMQLGCGHPAGPLAMLDETGLDVALRGLEALHSRTGDHLHAPAPILTALVAAGHTGRAAGKGIYSYDSSGAVVPDEDSEATEPAPREIRRIGIVGTGTMAGGIAEVCARSGYDVVVRARSAQKADAVRGAVERSLGKAVDRGKLEAGDRDAALTRLTGTAELADLADCDLVIEAVVEDLAVKTDLFAALDAVCKPGAVLATTTSSLPVTACARATSRPADVVGMHFFNPASIMRLVEVVPTPLTAQDVTDTVLTVTRAVGKHPVLCGDRPGFIVNALLFPLLNDAVKALEEQVVSLDDLDAAVVAATGYPMGPAALVDVVGLDVTLAIQRTLHAASREHGHAPAPSLEHLVRAGHLGRKAGRGMRPA